MNYPEAEVSKDKALELEKFRDIDSYTVKSYKLPIELMMENAGLQLANFVSNFVEKNQSVLVGVGNGNNGGGGLVAARRLAAWGYHVYLDIFAEITKELPAVQLERAIKFGAKTEKISKPDLWIDAYLGFSQRLPLSHLLLKTIEKANNSPAKKVSLDIPTGFLGNTDLPYFQSSKILTLAAPKKILYNLPVTSEIFVADIGIPKEAYEKFGSEMLAFEKENIIKLTR